MNKIETQIYMKNYHLENTKCLIMTDKIIKCRYCNSNILLKARKKPKIFCDKSCRNKWKIKNNPKFVLNNKKYYKKWYLKNREQQLKVTKEYGMKNREQITIRTLKWRKDNRKRFLEQHKIHAKNYNKKYPFKVLVRSISSKVKIPNQKCEECNIKKAIYKHHVDYRDPFAIMFVCFTCHRKLDKEMILFVT